MKATFEKKQNTGPYLRNTLILSSAFAVQMFRQPVLKLNKNGLKIFEKWYKKELYI